MDYTEHVCVLLLYSSTTTAVHARQVDGRCAAERLNAVVLQLRGSNGSKRRLSGYFAEQATPKHLIHNMQVIETILLFRQFQTDSYQHNINLQLTYPQCSCFN